MFEQAERPVSSTRERLRAALNQPLRGEPAVRRESVTELLDLSSLGGRWFESEHGPGYVIESVYEAGHAHGDITLHRALAIEPGRLAGQIRDPRLADTLASDFLYVDTETTGLGGAGMMVFLAGVARFDGSTLRLRQFLLPGPQYEGGLLGGLSRELDGAQALVSYNGKSFDVPALESRYILSRQRPSLRGLPHLDLLHPNRRLFKGAVESHRLAMVERELLGFVREDDCPSSEVPERYFRFQRSGDPTHIRPVLRHNAWDILSLVALAAHLAAVCDDGANHPLQAARAAEYAGDHASAAEHYETALDSPTSRGERLEALERAARCRARAGDWEAAARHWQSLIDEPRARRVLPFVELAKIAEHRLADQARAYVLTDQALDMARRGLIRPGAPGGELSIEALEHRRARLREKVERAAAAERLAVSR
ncbi:MAG: ribonuclease H-like domain-containing protein [Dehalococcoidia bacterium]